MSEFKRISGSEANQLLSEKPHSKIIDIRDEQSYTMSHINNAAHLHNGNIQEFILHSEFDEPLIIYCYHGISSQSAAQMFIQQGFEEVYSVDGGYEAWQQLPPSE